MERPEPGGDGTLVPGGVASIVVVLHPTGVGEPSAPRIEATRDRIPRHDGVELVGERRALTALFASPRKAVDFALTCRDDVDPAVERPRIAVHVGEVRPDGGPPTTSALEAAALLAGRAQPGEVVVSDVVRLLVGVVPGRQLRQRGRARLPGVDGRVSVWSLEDLSVSTPDERTIGRVVELEAIAGLFGSLADGGGGVLVLEGDAGIGKTHLLREAITVARARGFLVVDAGADDMAPRIGLLARAIDAKSPPSGPQGLGALLAEAPRDGDVADLSFAVVEAAVDAVDLLARDRPVMVVLDDAQWADDLSLALVRALARRGAVSRVGVLVAMRSTPRAPALDRLIDAVRDATGGHCELDSLDELDTQALAASIVGAAPGSELRSRLAATAGNPLFVTELLRSLEDEGLLTVSGGVADVQPGVMPAGLHETLVRRLSWLSDGVHALLRLASLLGTTFRLGDLAVVAGQPVVDVAAGIRDASASGLLTGAGEALRFRHDLVRDAVYGSMLPAERAELHLAAARALGAAGAPVQQVAAQYARGARRGDLDAVRWLARAADETVSVSPSAGVALYEQALGLAPELWGDADAIRARMIEPLAWCGRLTEAEAAARAVLDASPEDAIAFQALRGLSAVYGNRGQMADAVATIARAVAVPGAPAEECARMRCFAAQLGRLIDAIGDDEAVAMGRSELARAVADDDATGQCVAHQVLGAVASLTGHGSDALLHARHALALYESGRVVPRSYLIPDLFLAGELAEQDLLAEALEQGDRARRRYERRGARSQLPLAYMISAATHLRAGDYDRAVAEAEAAMAVIHETGSMNFVLHHHALLARVTTRRGELDRAGEILAEGAQRLVTDAPPFGADWLFDAQVEYLEASGDPAAALAVAELIWGQTASVRHFFAGIDHALQLARLAAAGDRPDLLDAAVAAIAEGSRRRPTASASAALAQSRALRDADGDGLERAVGLWRSSPRRPSLARCCEDAARHVGDRERRLSLLREASTIHAETGATGELERVEAAIRSAGGHKRSARAERPTFGWESLTPMENTVTALVAEGLTNPEIGERLHISRRTVETHLAHVFQKLGCSSRAQVAAEHARRDLPGGA
jgi:DNA-binding CsgD family transcriptional regulator/tetratricopeptide (TPR) repeat protein